MSSILLNSVTFYYTSPDEILFDNLNLNISTDWKLGLIGKNGRGKTTLLNLINKSITPVKGTVHKDINTNFFPYYPANVSENTMNVIKENIAPFSFLEAKMNMLTSKNDKESMEEYGEVLEKFQEMNGYEIDSMIEKEFDELGMSSNLLKREFSSLSGGEQTRSLLVSLFLKKDSFTLIDEPTNHLDMEGRKLLGNYLSKKGGFILVSHDRYFLDLCVDHIMSINKNDVRLSKGNYSQWKYNADLEEEYEITKSNKLKREIKTLEVAARKRRQWSDKKEKEITGSSDKGFISHRSAKLMKRALHIESRVDKKLEEKKALLKNFEKERSLKLNKKTKSAKKLMSISNAYLKLEDKLVLENFSLTVNEGDRVAIIGGNGCGKTTLVRVLIGELEINEGLLYKPNFVTISCARQNPLWDKGSLRKHLKDENIDETKFRNIMGVLGASGNLFERPLESFSKGELKKVELCKSYLEPNDLLIWDEPLNYLDVMSREQIEIVILKHKPSMIFTEHDKVFIEKIATHVIKLN